VLPGGRGEEVNGEPAYTGGHEHPRASVSGEPRQYSSPVTQLYRREDGQWKLAHRYADTLPSQMGDGVRVGR
jgi:ketosteroid isomerase-like protein